MVKICFFLVILSSCSPLYKGNNYQHIIEVNQDTGEREYIVYRLKEELKRRAHLLPSQKSLIIQVQLKEKFSPLVHLSNITEGRSLGSFFVSVEAKTSALKTTVYKTDFTFMASYTPDPYQEFANIQAKHIIENQTVFRLAEEIMMRLSHHINEK